MSRNEASAARATGGASGKPSSGPPMPAVRTPGFTWAVASRVTAFNESSEGGPAIP